MSSLSMDAHDEENCECSDDYDSEVLHVYPCFGKAHELSENCWCRPTGEHENGISIWMHEVYH